MIYLMRHGQDDESFIGGWSNVDLIPEGIKSVQETAAWIKDNLNIKRIVCSDVYRALHTAKIVNEYLDVPLEKSEMFREQSKGLLNGMPRDEANLKYGEFLNSVDKYTIYPQGESLEQLYLRIRNTLEDIKRMDDNTLIVTHRGVINMIYYLLLDIPLDMNKTQFGVTPASVHELDVNKNILRKRR